MNTNEQEYMDYLIHNRTELTNQNTKLLNKLDVLQKKVDIAVKVLKRISNPAVGDIYNELSDEFDYSLITDIASKALKEIDEVKYD